MHEYKNLMLLVAGYDHFYRQVSFKKHLYLYGVHYICRLYIFPCKWLSVSITGFKGKLLCVLEILFLGTFDKKKGTVHDIVGNLLS